VAAGCGTVCTLTGRFFAWSEAMVGGVAGVRCVSPFKAAEETKAPLVCCSAPRGVLHQPCSLRTVLHLRVATC
jgi:hypothetical protein